jgi:Copper type II ascorbate-dependent monooxygenase, C-terminal domain
LHDLGFTIFCYGFPMNLNARVMVVTALGLALFGGAMAGVRFSSVGETRPLSAHAHKAWQGNLNSSLPPVLPYIPTYYGHVRPILEAKCAGCHTEGGIAPFSLTDSKTATSHARAVQLAVQSKRMPPWLPAGESPAFKDARVLTDNEIAILANWQWAGSPLGKLENAAPVAVKKVQAKPDLSVDTGRDFTPDRSLTDEYRCFLIDPKLESQRFITGYNIVPGDPSVVHHVILFSIRGQTIDEAKQREANSDARGGWTCFGGPNVGNQALRDAAADAATTGDTTKAEDVLGYAGSWVPGSSAIEFPEGTGIALKPGTQLVMQVHYNLLAAKADKVLKDRTTAQFYLSKPSEVLKPLGMAAAAASVEIPCAGTYPTSSSDPCNRDAAYKVVSKYQEPWLTKILQSGLMATVCKHTLPTSGENSNKVVTQCDFPVNKNLLAIGAQGHMHTRGMSVKLEINPNDAKKRMVALDIPHWDFHWQSAFYFEKPFKIFKGDTLRITCTFDNSPANQPWINGVQEKPRYIVWGESTQDEMCIGNIQGVRE